MTQVNQAFNPILELEQSRLQKVADKKAEVKKEKQDKSILHLGVSAQLPADWSIKSGFELSVVYEADKGVKDDFKSV